MEPGDDVSDANLQAPGSRMHGSTSAFPAMWQPASIDRFMPHHLLQHIGSRMRTLAEREGVSAKLASKVLPNKRGFTSKKGAFLNSIWHCDCDPRMPADNFQTKNGGKNHGRWFYTCQQARKFQF